LNFTKNAFNLTSSPWAIIVVAVALIFGLSLFIANNQINTAESICRTNTSNDNYCRYKGKINQFYINKSGLALFYLETPFDITQAKAKGYEIANGSAVSIRIDIDDPVLKEMFNGLVFAFENDHAVEMHMRSVEQKYLEVDRFWIKKT
jgi:hypothetical protein